MARKTKKKNGENSYSGDDVKRYVGAVSEEFRGYVQVVAEQYTDIKKTLDSHTETLDQHTKTLDKHTEILDQHTETLDKHTEILDQHTKTLDKHTEILDQHTETLDRHTEILDQHTKTLDKHTEILGHHTESLDSHEGKLNSHTEMLGKIMEDVEILKGDMSEVKNDLKQKVDRSEFVGLERRTRVLESRTK